MIALKISVYLKNVDQKFYTFTEYNDLVKLNQEDKDKKVIYIYSSNQQDQHAYIEAAKNKGYDVLLMDGVVDSHFVNFLEHKIEGTSFVRVDAETTDKLIRKDETMVSVLNEEEQTQIKELAQLVVTGDNYIVNLEPLSEKRCTCINYTS